MESAIGAGRSTVVGVLSGLLAWAVPGAGHLWQGRVLRGLSMGGAVWIMFFFGLVLGGHLHSILGPNNGLLPYVFGFCNLGSGLVYLFCWASGLGMNEQAHLATSEYGNIFLMVAGLMNYLLMMDAFDIAIGRKP